MPSFVLKQDENNTWCIFDDGLCYARYPDKESAETEFNALVNCDHTEMEQPDWGSGNEVVVHCSFCGRSASFPLPVNLEWS